VTAGRETGKQENVKIRRAPTLLPGMFQRKSVGMPAVRLVFVRFSMDRSLADGIIIQPFKIVCHAGIKMGEGQ